MKRIIALLLCMTLIICSCMESFAAKDKKAVDFTNLGDSMKEKAKSAGNAISEGASKAGEAVKDGAEAAGNVISSGARKAGSSISSGAEKAGEVIKEDAKKAGNAISDGTEKAKVAAVKGAEKVGEAADVIAETAKDAKDSIVAVFKKIDPVKFKKGYEFVSRFTSDSFAAGKNYAARKEYFDSIQTAIDQMRDDMVNRVSPNSLVDSAAGYVVEDWHAGTFNVDAAVNGSKESAKVLGSTELGSVDVQTSYGENASLKYYKDGKASAKAQAANYMEAYHKYVNTERSKGNTDVLTEEEFLNQKCSSSELLDLYKSLYDGQTRIIPSDQMDEAVAYLTDKAAKEALKDSDVRKTVGKTAQETLDSLSDRLKAPDGTQSKPLTKKEAKAIAELCQTGKFDPADFGISVSKLIPTQYILKQAMGAGVTSAELRAVLSIGPQIFSIISEAIKTGDIDTEEVKKMGIDAVIAGSEGFLEGSVSTALMTACQAGTFGKAFINVSPDAIGALTVLAIDSVRYGYKMYNGEMTSAEYADVLTKEIFISVASLGTTALMVAVLPSLPIIYMAGSMAGGMIGAMLGESGYNFSKDLMMEVQGNGGFETIMPTNITADVKIGDSIVAGLGLKDMISEFKDFKISTTDNGKIKISMNN